MKMETKEATKNFKKALKGKGLNVNVRQGHGTIHGWVVVAPVNNHFTNEEVVILGNITGNHCGAYAFFVEAYKIEGLLAETA